MISTLVQPLVGYPLKLPLFDFVIKAGFPSPAESYSEKSLDLNDLAILHPEATYFLRASGDSMTGAGIFPGDYLVIDRSITPQTQDIVVAEIGGEFTLKRLGYEAGKPVLIPENPNYPTIRPKSGEELVIFGVVRGVYRNLK